MKDAISNHIREDLTQILNSAEEFLAASDKDSLKSAAEKIQLSLDSMIKSKQDSAGRMSKMPARKSAFEKEASDLSNLKNSVGQAKILNATIRNKATSIFSDKIKLVVLPEDGVVNDLPQYIIDAKKGWAKLKLNDSSPVSGLSLYSEICSRERAPRQMRISPIQPANGLSGIRNFPTTRG